MNASRFQYLRIADALRARVEGLPPNSLILTEHQLAREFGVSRLTVRQALHLLESAGLVSRQRGRGTIVSPPKVVRHWSPIATLEEDIQRQGVRLETRVLEYKREVPPSPSLRRRLGLPAEALVDVLTLLRIGDTRVLCFDRRSFASSIGPIDPLQVEQRPILQIIREQTGAATCTVSWEAEIVPSPTEVAVALRHQARRPRRADPRDRAPPRRLGHRDRRLVLPGRPRQVPVRGSLRPGRAEPVCPVSATELCYTSAVDLGALIRARRLSPVELCEAALARIERVNPRLNAFLTVTADRARAQARAAEARAGRAALLGAARRHPVLAQGPGTDGGRPDDVRLAVVRRARPVGGQPGRCPAGRHWRGAPGQDEHPAVRPQGLLR